MWFFSWCFQQRRINFLYVFRPLVIRQHSKCTRHVWYSTNLYFFDEMQPITGQFDPAMFILSRKSRKKLIIHIEKSKCVSIKSLNYLTLWFVNICIHSKKRMGSSIDFCSQSKPVERPVQPVFPDYLSVSCDCDSKR